MSDVKRVHGWPINTPIPLVGGGEAFVVGERESSQPTLSGYRIHHTGDVRSMTWSESGQSGNTSFDLDQSYRKLPEPELPLWTIEDSKSLLGKVLLHKSGCTASFVDAVREDGALSANWSGVSRTYKWFADEFTHLDGTPIPARRFQGA